MSNAITRQLAGERSAQLWRDQRPRMSAMGTVPSDRAAIASYASANGLTHPAGVTTTHTNGRRR